ncbi:MAG: succinylglutamate desuccinylase/aspartoacylase family protein [Candidatus Marinimicrobia bacterium]|nr:succinylglutamate desuccinylase/aspartoacylase family protein [Candidatus Neomarinimicrobiota bacterium]
MKHLNSSHKTASKHYSFVNILSASDLTRRRLPRMSIVSPVPGPTLWLTACGHGDEVSGMVIIQELFKRLGKALLCGSVHALPLMNPLGFETATRHLPLSREDLNRSFPGNPDGTLGERMAHAISKVIEETRPDLVLDLHNDWIESIPYVLIDHDPGKAQAETVSFIQRIALDSGFCVIRDTDELYTSLSYTLLQKNIPALTVELGKPHVFSELNLEHGFNGIWNMLATLGIVHQTTEPFRYPLPSQYQARRILRYTDKPYGTHTGVIRFMVKPGMSVRGGQGLAQIRNVFGKRLETIKASQAGLILGHADSAAAHPGVPLVALGVPE